MKAAILDSFGESPVFGDFQDPVAEPGERVVDVLAASIKQLDRAIASGKHYSSPRTLPIVPGTDGVTRLADGRLAYFAANRRPFGAMAERAIASWTVPLPDGMDDALAAAIVNPAIGAWLPLIWRGALQAGETVLILGATGATGKLAVRAAQLLGAGRVIAAGRRRDVLEGLGADATIDLTLPPDALREAFAREAANGIDVVVDYIWGAPVEQLIDVLVKNDLHSDDDAASDIRLVSVGQMAGADIRLPSTALRGSRLSIIGSGTANFPPAARMQAIVADILNRAHAGEISLAVDQVPLSDVARVWSAATGDARIVLRP